MKVLYRQRQEVELGQSYFSRFPESRDSLLRQTFTLEPGARGQSGLRTRFEGPLVVLGWLAAAVLLIACANIAGLLLARGAASQRDLAVRRAIGASRGRIVGQLFTESVLLAGISAIVALFLASWLTRLLLALLLVPATGDLLPLSATPDLRILAFTVTVTVLTALLCGLLAGVAELARCPDRHAPRAERLRLLAPGRTSTCASSSSPSRSACPPCCCSAPASSCGRSTACSGWIWACRLRESSRSSPGRRCRTRTNARSRRTARSSGGLQRSRAWLPSAPGVPSCSAATERMARSTVAGKAEFPFTFFNAVTPGYFEALGIPVKAGVGFDWRDWGSGKRLALVNEVVTAAYFDGVPPLDRMIGQGTRAATDRTIVGVFGNSRYHDVRGEVPPQTFFNMDSVMEGVGRISVYVRVNGDPREFMNTLRDHAHRIDSNLVISSLRTLDDQIATRMSNERMLSFLSIGFALLATILAVVGVHGVLAFQIARRTREIGVRMALGAPRALIVRLVAREMSLVVLAGLAGGVATAYACGRYVQSQLFEVQANDPLVFAVAVVTLLGAAATATLIPALRASRMNVIRALRYE